MDLMTRFRLDAEQATRERDENVKASDRWLAKGAMKMDDTLDPHFQKALEHFVSGSRSGMILAYKNAARFLFRAAREAPIPCECKPALRMFAKELNRRAREL